MTAYHDWLMNCCIAALEGRPWPPHPEQFQAAKNFYNESLQERLEREKQEDHDRMDTRKDWWDLK